MCATGSTWRIIAVDCARCWRRAAGRNLQPGGDNERTNLEVVLAVCALLDQARPRADGASYKTQITRVADRAGHDRRYAIDTSRVQRELGWRPVETFQSYRENPALVSGQPQWWPRSWREPHRRGDALP
ncbi:GDP-mannose 4,6-dehydratase [Achromobacter insuavis]